MLGHEDNNLIDHLKENLKELRLQNEMLWKVVESKQPTEARSERTSPVKNFSGEVHTHRKYPSIDPNEEIFKCKIKVSICKFVLEYDKKNQDISTLLIKVRPEKHNEWVIKKRLFDVVLLDERLRKEYPLLMKQNVGKFMDKKVIKGQSPAIKDLRKRATEFYFEQILAHIPKSAYLQRFLTTDVAILPSESTMKSSPIIGSIYLNSFSVSSLNHELHQVSKSAEYRHAFVIELHEDNSKHILCAENEEEKENWIQILKSDLAYSSPESDGLEGSRSTAGSFSRNRFHSETHDRLKKNALTRNRSRTLFAGDLEDALHDAQITRMFGVSVGCAVSFSRGENTIPIVVRKCIEFVEKERNIREEGLYRVSGGKTNIEALKAAFDEEGDAIIEEDADVHTITGLLKLYFRELPANILHSPMLKVLHSHQPEEGEQTVIAQQLVRQIPRANYDTLAALCDHLFTVSQHAESNKMTIRNVVIIFSATLNIPCWLLKILLLERKSVFPKNIPDNFFAE